MLPLTKVEEKIIQEANSVKCKDMKTIVNFVITALTQDNIGTLSIVSVIQDTKHQKNFVWCFIMFLIMTTIS